MRSHSQQVGMFALALPLLVALAGCGGDEVNYLKNDGSYCLPQPESRTEDCYLDEIDPEADRFRVNSTEDLEKVCASKCDKVKLLDVADVDGLKNLRAFEGIDVVHAASISMNPELKSTKGLHLRDGASFRVLENPSLETVFGLEDVRTATTIKIDFNPNVNTVHGLENIEKVWEQGPEGEPKRTRVQIGRTQLSSLNELDGLKLHQGSTFRLRDNPNIKRIPELSGEKVAKVLIHDNDSLKNVDGLRGIDALYKLEIYRNSSLKNCHIQDAIDGIEPWGPDVSRKMYVADNSSASCN